MDIKSQRFDFFNWEEFENPFGTDIYNITQSVDKRGKAYFDRNPSNPIDTLSALVNCVIAARINFGFDRTITG